MGTQYFEDHELEGIRKMYSKLETQTEDDIGCLYQGCGCGCLIMALGGTFGGIGLAYLTYHTMKSFF